MRRTTAQPSGVGERDIQNEVAVARNWLVAGLAALLYCLPALAADKSGVTPNTISLPKGPGAIEGLGESFQPALNTGTAGYGLAIILPPGTAGHAPDLRLTYEGGAGNGPLGFGWTLPSALVQRRTDEGIPTYGRNVGFPRTDSFINHLKEELVPLTNGFWFSRNEGAFIRYRSLTNGWEGVLPNGTVMVFGLSEQARIEGPETNQVFSWLLEQERDTHNNTILYSYGSFPGSNNLHQKYLQTIRYGPGSPPWNNFHFVSFIYEDRPDWFEDARAGFLIRTGKRLKQIVVGTQGPTLTNHLAGDFDGDGTTDYLNRRYEFSYRPYAGTNSHWSLLGSVTVFGADGVTALPPAAFGYTVSHPPDSISAANHIIQSENEPPVVMDNTFVDFLDLNGDGLPDVLRTDPAGSTHLGYLNRGESLGPLGRVIRWRPAADLGSQDGQAVQYNLSSPAAHLADMDGDGLADLAITALDGGALFFVNRGTLAWGPRRDMSTEDSPPPSPFSSPEVRTADLDFDKRIDIVQSISTGSGADYRVWFNLGQQAWSPSTTVSQTSGFLFSTPGVQIADFNGDRVPDVVWVRPEWLVVTAGLGYGRFAPPVQVPLTGAVLDDDQATHASLNDINGDGLVDLVLERAVPGQLWYWLNLGNYSLAPRKVVTGMPTSIGAAAAIRWADLNANGTTDLIYADSSSSPRLQMVELGELLNAGTAPNMLVAISNGVGRVTLVSYESSITFALADATDGQPWPDLMPNPVSVVASITNLDSLGHSYVTRFRYHNGYYDPEEKQFRGFGQTEQIDVGDLSAPTLVSRSTFSTGRDYEPLKGKLLSLSAELEDGRQFSAETNLWSIPPVTLYTGTNGTNVVFVHPTGTRKLISELGQGLPRHLETELAYDLYGNQTTNANYGLTENGNRVAGNDERIVVSEFAVNTSAWMVRSLKRQEIQTLEGVVVSRIENFYDDPSFSGTNFGSVSRGDLTLTRSWHDPSSAAKFVNALRAQFDSYGNQVLLADPLGNAANGQPNSAQGHFREFAYDSRFHSYPVTETVHVGGGSSPLVFRAGYDEGLGTPRFSLDFNTNQTAYRHDPLGRIVAIIKPDDTPEYPSTEYAYSLAQPTLAGGLVNYIETRLLDRPPGSIGGPKADHYHFTRQFVDGLGRTLLTKEEAEPETPGGPARGILNGAVQFNARLQAVLKLNACFSTRSGLDQALDFEDISAPGWQGVFSVDGQLQSLTLAAAHKTQNRYDATLRLLSAANQDGSSATTAYQPLLTTISNENVTAGGTLPGATMVHHRDGLARLVRVDEIVRLNDDGTPAPAANTWTTRYEYDANDQLTAVVDSQNNRKTMAFDGLKRRTFLNDPDRGVMHFEYDDASNLKQTIDAKNQVITYAYDGANRLLSETYVGSTLSPRLGEERGEGNVNVACHYDTAAGLIDAGDGTKIRALNTRGMLAFVSDTSGEEHISYDSRGRIEYIVKRIPSLPTEGGGAAGNPLASYRTMFEHDSMDRLTRLVYPDNDQVLYQYNERTLLSRIVGGPSGSIISNLTYWPSDQQRQFDFGNGVRTSHAYDTRLRLIQLAAASPAQPLIGFRYEFDPASNIKSIADERPGALIPVGDKRRNTQIFQYDHLFRLTQARYSFGAPGGALRNDGEINYRYDRIGNLLAQSSTIEHKERGLPLTDVGLQLYGGTAGSANRSGRGPNDPPGPHALSQITGTSSNAPPTRTFPYDANGNLTSIDGLACTWDFKNRLVSTKDSSGRVEYTYDYTDRRITKRVVKSGMFVVYVSQFFELREHNVPTKYVFNGDTRVAQAVLPLFNSALLQRLPLSPGWNLSSVALSIPNVLNQLTNGGLITAAYQWRPADRIFVPVAAGQAITAGSVLWLYCSSNTVLSLSGTYSSPMSLALAPGGQYISSAGFQVWDLTDQLPASATLWKLKDGTWKTRLPALPAYQDVTPLIGPGEALFVDVPGPVVLQPPDPALRLLYYHPDHLGSSSSISDAAGQLVAETAYYPFGAERHLVRPVSARAEYAFAGKERDAEHGMLNFDSRLLWPGGARFIRPDSLADKFKENSLHGPQNWNPYSYVLNNPLALNDPDGREARVIIHGNGKVTIQLAIQYVGPLATKANIARANKGIEKYWTGKFGRYNVTMKVLGPGDDPTLKPAVVTLTGKDEKKQYLRSFVKVDEDTGQWNPKDAEFNWVAAHEAGHLMGLDDRYKDAKGGGSVVDRGWRGNMMGETWGRVEQRNIDELVSTSGTMVLRDPKQAEVKHHRQVVDASPEGNRAGLERDMNIQMKAWLLNDPK